MGDGAASGGIQHIGIMGYDGTRWLDDGGPVIGLDESHESGHRAMGLVRQK